MWWRRWHDDSDAELDNTHLMRMAGRFARRVKAWGAANAVPVIFCKAGERKHRIAEEYLATHDVGVGVFLILAAKAPATVWKVNRSAAGVIVQHREKNRIRQPLLVPHHRSGVGARDDQDVGASAVRGADHPQRPRVRRPAGAGGGDSIHQGRQLLHRGRRPRGPGSDRRYLVAGRGYRAPEPGLRSWIYSACLCFGLDLDEQQRSGFGYAYSVYQVEYSRNLIFADGHRMEQVFDTVVDRTRSRLDVPKLRTIFGAAQRPRHTAPTAPRRSRPRSRHLRTT